LRSFSSALVRNGIFWVRTCMLTMRRTYSSRHNFWCASKSGRPHTGFVGSLFFMSHRTGHGSSKVFEMLPAFRAFHGRALFVRGVMHPYFSVGPLGSLRGYKVRTDSAGWLFWNLMVHPLLGEADSTSPPRWL
jgi:hypothetical protein